MVDVDPIVGKGTERRPVLSSKATEMGLEWLLEARDLHLERICNP